MWTPLKTQKKNPLDFAEKTFKCNNQGLKNQLACKLINPFLINVGVY